MHLMNVEHCDPELRYVTLLNLPKVMKIKKTSVVVFVPSFSSPCFFSFAQASGPHRQVVKLGQTLNVTSEHLKASSGH